MNKYIRLLCMCVAMLCDMAAMALSVGGLTVNSLVNPTGIDTPPTLAWKLMSDKRGVKQTSYKVNIYVNAERSALVWSSGNIESDESTNVKVSDFVMEPATRYYWEVEVTDNHGQSAVSAENAFFTTGLMDDWGEAKWIRATEYQQGYFRYQDIRNYTIEADVEIVSSGAGLCFGKDDDNTYKMWHLQLADDGRVWLTPQYWDKGNHKIMDKVLISNIVRVKAGETFNLRLEICDDLKRCVTYINDVMVDNRTGWFPYRQIGFRMGRDSNKSTESACFDNIKVVDTATGEIKFCDDFSVSNSFSGAEVVNGRLMVSGPNRTGAPDVEAWQKTGRMRYSVDADVTVVSGNPGLVFGWTANRAYFTWNIVTNAGKTPKLRRNIRSFSDKIESSDIELTQFTVDEIIGHQRHWHIDVDYNIVMTYIDGQLVDSFVCNIRPVVFGCVGFSGDESVATAGDEAYFDNIVVKQYYPDELPLTVVDEDFEAGWSNYFMDLQTVDVNGDIKCHLTPGSLQDKTIQTRSEIPSFYRAFDVDHGISSAILYTTALGLYDLWINGERVGHLGDDGTMVYEEMKPGWTNYRKRVFYSTHDVTDMMVNGQNVIGAVVTPGWYNGNIARNVNTALGTNALMCKLVIRYVDGSVETVVTDESWRVSKEGPLMQSDIYFGEYYDATRCYPWDRPDWDPHPSEVQIADYPGIVESLCGPHVRAVESLVLKPLSVIVYDQIEPNSDYGSIQVKRESAGTSFSIDKGETAILDFGQNHAGVARFVVRGKRGTRVRIRYAEMLNDSGDESRGNDGPKGSIYRANLKGATQELNYTLAGNEYGDMYSSNSTVSGYRYCEVTSTEPVEFVSFISRPMTSSYDETGSIVTDQPLVNQMFSNARWGQLSNLLSVPTDCPNRSERVGWSADTQLFSITGMFNANVSEFYRKWLTDMRDCQRPNGEYSDIAPESLVSYGNAGWADAGIIVPWTTYLMSGNKDIIAENYEAMERYMDWMANQSVDWFDYPGAGKTIGDWLGNGNTPDMLICMAYYAYDAMLMSNMSRALSEHDSDSYAQKADYYYDLFVNIRADFQKHYSHDYLVKTRVLSQSACVLPLMFDLYLDSQQAQDYAKRLYNSVIGNGYCLDTGFLGTAYILPVLSDNGYGDMAYNLLMQHHYPSWIYSIDQGATTYWERWNSYTLEDGFGDATMNSFNHYAYGAVVEWMYRYMAGISPVASDPGFRTITLKPFPDMRHASVHGVDDIVRHVTANYESPYGRVISEWELLDDNSLNYHIRVPANTTAHVHIPVESDNTDVYEGKVPAELSEGVEYVGFADGRKVYNVQSGDYTFTTQQIDMLPVVLGNSGITIYPNPVTDVLNIRTTDNIRRVTLLSASGATVRQYIGNQSSIDLTGVPSGMYMLVVDTDRDTCNAKVVKR